ncbi:MAG: hypothetical protein RBS55_04040 [Bacteroidales bacterium]|jgi:hypothetical protein|nr:hypothetical protein [Bacteroidales bacterium]
MKNLVILSQLVILLFFSQNIFSQVAINTSGADPDPSAVLDINAPDKGLLIPRVTLLSKVNNNAPIQNPATGLMIYNLGGNNLDAGFYIWNGMTWSALATVEQVMNVANAPQPAAVFGELYEYHNIGDFTTIQVASGGTWMPWITAQEGDTSEMTASGSILTILNPGTYTASFDAALQMSSGGKITEAALFVNGIRQDDMRTRCWFKEGSKAQNFSFSGLIELNEGDVVSVKFTVNENGTIRLEMANLNLTRLN